MMALKLHYTMSCYQMGRDQIVRGVLVGGVKTVFNQGHHNIIIILLIYES